MLKISAAEIETCPKSVRACATAWAIGCTGWPDPTSPKRGACTLSGLPSTPNLQTRNPPRIILFEFNIFSASASAIASSNGFGKTRPTEGEQSADRFVKWISVVFWCFWSIMNCSHWAGFKPKHLQKEEGWAFGDKRRWRLLGWPQLCPSKTGGGRRQPWWCVMLFFFVFLW